MRHFESSTYQCGIRKSCYVSLKTCDVDPKTCNFVLSWDFDGDYVNFELTGLTYSWISVLFTDDQYLVGHAPITSTYIYMIRVQMTNDEFYYYYLPKI